ncbi:MAG: acyltransferase [Pseudomonadota bacterium]
MPGTLKLESLQILRAIAALAVVLFHLGIGWDINFGLAQTNPFEVGANGVDMFFVISGFIICYASVGTQSSIEFLKKRAFRILPLYYALTLGLFLIAIITPQLLNSTEANVWHLIKSFTFIPYENSGGLVQPILFLGWTLNFEMFFYLLFALCIRLHHREIVVTLIVMAIAALGYFIHFGHVVPDFFSRSIILNFAWGVGVFLIYQHRPYWIEKLYGVWIPAALFILAQFFWDIPISAEFAIGVPTALILASLLPAKQIEGPIGKVGNMVGDASYSLYLIHPYIIQFCFILVVPVLGGSMAVIVGMSVASFVLSIIASIMLFKIIEKPSNMLLRQWFLAKTT